ncbi:MAG: hypothetical protein MJ211_04935 [Bacteroidales bacterium]|nr:hypothetical protein [Bacteroidales bacterium]
MIVIGLKGDSNQGKTTTLKIVYQLLKFENEFEYHSFQFLGDYKDFRDILQIRGYKVGIVSQGDNVRDGKKNLSVDSHLRYFENEECDIVICACSIKGRKQEPQKDIEKFEHIIIDKNKDEENKDEENKDEENKDKVNEEYAKKIIDELNKKINSNIIHNYAQNKVN